MKDIRKDFPYLTFDKQRRPLIYLDNAATSQKPRQVIDRIAHFYAHENAPVHRGLYSRAETVTQIYEESRNIIAKFLNAYDDEIVFTKGTTEGINFIASTWAWNNLKEGDEIILSEFEHHSNILPWIHLSVKKGVKIKYVPLGDNGLFDYEFYKNILNEKTKLVSISHCSNAIGVKVDIDLIIKYAKQVNAKVLVDAAQTVGHEKTDLKKMAPDFLVFSGHKMFGPTGIGILYIPRHMHEFVDPYQFGGGMVFDVECYDATWLKSPQRYEAGTPPIAQAVGLAEAVNYFNQKINFDDFVNFEAGLCRHLIEEFEKINSIRILGPIDQIKTTGHIVSFICNKMHSHDIAAYLNQYDIAIRAGNHCAQPLYQKMGITGSVRISFHAYNNHEEIEYMINILKKLLK